jgi:hypothetical protein
VTIFLAPEILDGSPLVAELFLGALGGDEIARRELTDLALTEALAAVALEMVVGIEADAAEQHGGLPVLPAGVEARIVAAVRQGLADT